MCGVWASSSTCWCVESLHSKRQMTVRRWRGSSTASTTCHLMCPRHVKGKAPWTHQWPLLLLNSSWLPVCLGWSSSRCWTLISVFLCFPLTHLSLISPPTVSILTIICFHSHSPILLYQPPQLSKSLLFNSLHRSSCFYTLIPSSVVFLSLPYVVPGSTW